MARRYVSIWFKNLSMDYLIRKHPKLSSVPCAIELTSGNKSTVFALNDLAASAGVTVGMKVADAQALCPKIEIHEHDQERIDYLLKAMADWCYRYSPIISIDAPDGLIIDVSGCTHLLGGEKQFLKDVVNRFCGFGYQVRVAMADTVGTAWAVARYGVKTPIIPVAANREAITSLPPKALRLPAEVTDNFWKLGIHSIGFLMGIPRHLLVKRFGRLVASRIDQALGEINEYIKPNQPAPVYSARLDILETISTAEAIAIGVMQTIEELCAQLDKDQRGLQEVKLTSYRVDGFVQHLTVGTSLPTRNAEHVFRLFRDKLTTLIPGLGIELFILSATHTEPLSAEQEKLIHNEADLNDDSIAKLVDKVGNHFGKQVHGYRFQSRESHLPERAVTEVSAIKDKESMWPQNKLRPHTLLKRPELIEVTAAKLPDYPPRKFKYKNTVHDIKRADGPERIESEWWLQKAELRDYYRLEDAQGKRFWVYRLGEYGGVANVNWYIHGFFG